MNRVLVVGSINMDLVVEAAQFPAPGETVLGQRFKTFAGGKGANQAVAARRLGAEVSIVGRVGNDAFGDELIDGLAREGITTAHVGRGTAPTGVAAITVSRAENAIVVVPGANQELTADDIDAAESAFARADVVLCQLEIPLAAVEATARLATRHRKPLILNPAPAQPLPAQLLEQITLLTPNEHELALVFSCAGEHWQDALRARPQRLLMTQGAQGAWFADAGGVLRHQPAFPVEAVDTTGAGDTFNGALAAFWGSDLTHAAQLACAASALSVTRAGAQGGMPTRAELIDFLKAKSINVGKLA